MILAAGFGTRLLPYTKYTPKALFPVRGKPIIDRTIRYLINAGCDGILINTHHLHHQIAAFIANQRYAIPVQTRYEPVILGTGGGIKNAADFFDDQPFVVLNSDIVTDIPIEKVYAFHHSHGDPVTLVLHDDPRINTVMVDSDLCVVGFSEPAAGLPFNNHRRLTFTGLQVLDPEVLGYIPDKGFSSSIDAYRRMIQEGGIIRSYLAECHHWRDIGTPASYRDEALEALLYQAFNVAHPVINKERLAGDGSDRRWYRLTVDGRTLILADHGIRSGNDRLEIDAFIDIGRHLRKQAVALPQLIAWDRFSGLVLMNDLGDCHLQTMIQDTTRSDQVVAIYQRVIDQWVQLATNGYKGFNLDWTYQTQRYDRRLIVEKECQYFVDAFLNGYLDMDVDATVYQSEFTHLADHIMSNTIDGLLHRDCQSRNIMVKEGCFYFIDFQGARIGPIQYDLASLLIDPYVELPAKIQTQMQDYAFDQLTRVIPIDRHRFITGYRYCALARNLQILGAFGYLTRVKEKIQFKAYIPAAVRSLSRILESFSPDEFPALKSIANCIKKENGISKKNGRNNR